MTKDIVARLRGLTPPQAERLTRLTPLLSTVVMTVLVVIALWGKITLWRLPEVKFELLIQLSAAFVLGTLHRKDAARAFSGRDILSGLLAGVLLTGFLYLSQLKLPGGFHAGVMGVGLNYTVAAISRRLRLARRQPSTPPAS